MDDYYLNLLDWSSGNVLAVALGASVYLWHAESGAISELMQTAEYDDFITSVSWAADGKHIAVGIHSAEVQIWDADKGVKVFPLMKILQTLHLFSLRKKEHL